MIDELRLLKNEQDWEAHKREYERAYQTAVRHEGKPMKFPCMVFSDYGYRSGNTSEHFIHDFVYIEEVIPLIKVEHDRLLEEKIDSTILTGE